MEEKDEAGREEWWGRQGFSIVEIDEDGEHWASYELKCLSCGYEIEFDDGFEMTCP